MSGAQTKRRALRDRDGDLCYWCGGKLLFGKEHRDSPDYASLEHLTPRSCRGSDKLENLVLAHQRCNEARGCSPAWKYRAKLDAMAV